MKPRNPPRRTNSSLATSSKTAPRVLYAGRPEQPTVIRHPKATTPWVLVGLVIVLMAAALLGSSKVWEGSFAAGGSSYEQRYEVRNVMLQSEGMNKGRVRWTVTARVMNATRETVPGPRLRIRLLRTDKSVLAEEVVDYSRRSLAELSGINMTYQMDVASVEPVHAEITVIPPREGVYDRTRK